ncbi:MAG TPA: DUF3459 domain-containing protein, partial [Acidimicrobiales bacterium]|nr:DUF3459 domain-containing protein [Acidimicrobiales bacterium]
TMVRDLIDFRRRSSDLWTGGYVLLAASDELWAWRRGEHVAVVLNFGNHGATLQGLHGRISVATDRARAGQLLKGTLELSGWEGMVVELDSAGADSKLTID